MKEIKYRVYDKLTGKERLAVGVYENGSYEINDGNCSPTIRKAEDVEILEILEN